MSEDVLLGNLGEGIFEIRLNRPEKMNALSVAAVAAVSQAVSDAQARNARVILVTGNGRAFCAGADLTERKGLDFQGKLDHNAGINRAVNALAEARCVTVAVLNGLALGGGLEMALGCDLRIAAAGISVGLTESRVGAFPGAGGTQRLARTVGRSRALQMMLTGESVTSEYAERIGLVNEVVPAEQLQTRALELAKLLASRSATAQADIKRLVNQGLEVPLATGLQMERAAVIGVFNSVDYAEGLAAFAEKRAPKFVGVVQ